MTHEEKNQTNEEEKVKLNETPHTTMVLVNLSVAKLGPADYLNRDLTWLSQI